MKLQTDLTYKYDRNGSELNINKLNVAICTNKHVESFPGLQGRSSIRKPTNINDLIK